jgi:hypothetical protein
VDLLRRADERKNDQTTNFEFPQDMCTEYQIYILNQLIKTLQQQTSLPSFLGGPSIINESESDKHPDWVRLSGRVPQAVQCG